MLLDHGIVGGLHMKEFSQSGKLRGITPCCRNELFLQARHLIEHYSAMTIAVGISTSQYEQYLPMIVRKRFCLYAMCFHIAVMMNHELCESNGYKDRVPYILDAGNSHADHVRSAHQFIVKQWQKYHYLHAGGLFFEDDECFGTLQAADILAWSTRRKLHQKPFPPGFETLEEMVSIPSRYHKEWVIPEENLRELGEVLQKGIDCGDHEKEITDEDIRGF